MVHGYDQTVRSLGGIANTVRRTVIAFFPVFAAPDDAFAARLLPEVEFDLYRRMDVRDRLHACAVTRQLLGRYPEASSELRRAALLHDVGKASARYNPWWRVLVALYTPRQIAAEPRLGGVRGAWQLKRHHDRYGAAQIVAAGGDRRVAEIVACHHGPGGDREAARLREIDARF